MSDNVEKPEPVYGNITGEVPVTRKSLKPQPKVAAAGIAGAVTVLIVWAARLLFPDVEIPTEVAAALTAVIAFAAGYIKS